MRIAAALLSCLLAACAGAPPEPPGCPASADIADKVQRFAALQPFADAAPGLTMDAAACGARKFVAALVPTYGKVVGYKAGLTTPQVQQRFGVSAPIRGALLARMLLRDGAAVPAAFGARPFVEPDLMVEVGSSAIHDAKTPQEVLANLRAVIPFIELPDLLVADVAKVNGPTIAVNNVGAGRGGLADPGARRRRLRAGAAVDDGAHRRPGRHVGGECAGRCHPRPSVACGDLARGRPQERRHHAASR
jgi:2-keto-4-pentenoate hydratase